MNVRCGQAFLVIVAFVTALASRVDADTESERADALFEQGKQLIAAGKTAEACAAFDDSQRLEPAIATMLNQADCRERNGQLATAWRLFREVARQTMASKGPRKQLNAVAAKRAAELEPRLSTLRIDVPDAHRVAGLVIHRDRELIGESAWNQTQPIDAGTYVLTAEAPRHTKWSTTISIALARDAKRVEVPLLAPEDPNTHGSLELHGPQPPAAVDADEAPGTWSTQRKVAVGFAALALASTGTAIVLGTSAQSRRDEALGLCLDPGIACRDADRANSLLDSARGRASGANASVGVAVGAALVAGVLWFMGAPEASPSMTAAPTVTSNGATLTVIGSF